MHFGHSFLLLYKYTSVKFGNTILIYIELRLHYSDLKCRFASLLSQQITMIGTLEFVYYEIQIKNYL